jgi:PAS domain S-box-containing protein
VGEISQPIERTVDVRNSSREVLPFFGGKRQQRGLVKVLVADDRSIVEPLTGLLIEWGYDPVTMSTGKEALALLAANDGPSLVVLDWMLPDISGAEICRRLRASHRSRSIYIILLIGDDESNDVVKGLRAGADDYLRKPYDPSALRARLDAGSRIVVQKALRESEERFQSAFENAGVGMALVDLNGKWLQVNAALCDFLGYTRDELLASDAQAITLPDDLPLTRLSLQRLRDGTSKIYEIEKRYLHKQGHVVWSLVTGSPVANAEGKPTYLFAQIQDISKRKHAEDALRAAHAESELFINSVPSILIGTDDKGRITRWNLAAAKTFALLAPAVSGKSLNDCGIRWVSPNIKAEIDSWLQIEKGGKRSDLLFEKDNEQHFLGLSVNRVIFANEKTAGLLITGVDITERRHLEEQLKQAQKLEAIGQLAAGIAHEINTPTQYVGDNTTFIKQSWSAISDLAHTARRLDDESQAGVISRESIERLHQCVKEADLDYLLDEMPKAIDQSLEGVQRVAKIVHAMKEFSHPGSEEKTALDLNRAIETTITVARNEWKYVSEVETCFDPELPLVHCHAGEFNQVILNLLINAAHAIRQVVGDASSAKGEIRVATSHIRDEVEISIRDTGCGIPEAIQSRVFEPFFTTKPVGQGTGQGLALAHTTIVRRHGGRLWFETVEGRGTTFFIRLPVLPSDQES